MAVVNTMVVGFSPSTGLMSVTPTLPALAAAPAFMLLMIRNSYGIGDYKPYIMSLLGTLPQTRGQLPFRRTQFFIRVVDINGAVYDSPEVEMDYSNSVPLAGNVSYTEAHIPERSILGEVSRAHAFSYQLKGGAGVPGTIVDPIRNVFVPDGTLASVGAYAIAGVKAYNSTAPFFPGDEGERTHSFELGYY